MMSPALLIRTAGLGIVLVLVVPIQYLATRLGWHLAGRLPLLVHRIFLRIFAIRVTTVGAPPSPATPTLVLANHVSWLDIPVMASLVPLSFVAKSEIERWPVVGALAKLQRCIFIDRSRKAATAEVNAVVAGRLAGGDAILLFPEGTTGDGLRLLPFRSSLVGAARAALAGAAVPSVQLQPLAIVYAGRNGLPVTRREMPDIAWYGDMELAPHLAGFFRGGSLEVVAIWGEPIAFAPGMDRKRATAAAEAAVRAAIESVRTGRVQVHGSPAHASLAAPKVVKSDDVIRQTPRPQRA